MYALLFQIGILGMILTFALVRQLIREKKEKSGKNVVLQILMASVMAVILAGNAYTTREEIRKAPARKYACSIRAEIARDFENRSDEELQNNFEYQTGSIEGGQKVRRALEILKENKWNVFRE